MRVCGSHADEARHVAARALSWPAERAGAVQHVPDVDAVPREGSRRPTLEVQLLPANVVNAMR